MKKTNSGVCRHHKATWRLLRLCLHQATDDDAQQTFQTFTIFSFSVDRMFNRDII